MNECLKLNKFSLRPPSSPVVEECYPRIYDTILGGWGTEDCRAYLTGLSVQSRDENREGFPFSALMEISELLEAHDNDFPGYKPFEKIYFR